MRLASRVAAGVAFDIADSLGTPDFRQLSMLNRPARIPRCQRFTGRLAMTRAWLAVWRGVARSFATGACTPPLHQFARTFQRFCRFYVARDIELGPAHIET